MKRIAPLLAMLVLLAGCRAKPVVAIDPRILDCVPVVAIVLDGNRHSTGLLLDYGTVLMSSHALPDDEDRGKAEVSGFEVEYRVASRGSFRGSIDRKLQPAPGPLEDWAVITPDPPIARDRVVGCTVPLVVSFEPPRFGETVYYVGYTAEPEAGSNDRLLVRYWVPFVVTNPPWNFRSSFGDSVFWLQAPSRRFVRDHLSTYNMLGRPLDEARPGFSGGPLLRLGHDSLGNARLEVCGVMQGRRRGAGDLGLAVVPRGVPQR
jgi:hypothetical protein